MKRLFILLFPVQVFCTATTYYPLHADNSWTLQSQFLISIQTLHENIVETKSHDGVDYYKFDYFRNASGVWVGISGELVLTLVGGTAHTLYDFGAGEGDTWTAPDPPSTVSGRVKLVSKTEEVETFAGTFENCYHFSHRIDDSNSYDEWFAPGVGLVKRETKLMGGSIEALLIEYSVNTTHVKKPARKQPGRFILHAGYPNPFNASTTIGLTMPGTAGVRIDIFDATGRSVERLVDHVLPEGEYRFIWSAARQPSGVYWIRAVTGTQTEVRKMLLQK